MPEGSIHLTKLTTADGARRPRYGALGGEVQVTWSPSTRKWEAEALEARNAEHAQARLDQREVWPWRYQVALGETLRALRAHLTLYAADREAGFYHPRTSYGFPTDQHPVYPLPAPSPEDPSPCATT